MHEITKARQLRAILLFIVTYSVFALWCVRLFAQTNGFIRDPEIDPPEQSYIQLKENRQKTAELQDTYRKRLPIPDAVSERVREEYMANIARMATETKAEPAGISKAVLVRMLLYGGIVILVSLLAVRRFIPSTDWKLDPVKSAKLSAKVRAEEEAFEKFMIAFSRGPSPPPEFLTGDKTTGEGKTTFIRRTVKEFPERAANLLAGQYKLLHEIDRATSDSARQKKLAGLCAEMGKLKEMANFSEVLLFWQLASALEGLLHQLSETSANINSSTLRTVRSGIDLLDDLCRSGDKPSLLTDRPLRFLAVDDDMISRKAITLALKNAFNVPDLAVDAETALALVSEKAYDVIFLDVKLPGMDGFELCLKIHDSPSNQCTPVVFVTSHSDFNMCAQSVISGGSDLLGKPYLTFEVTVKALTLGLRGRMKSRTRSERLPMLDCRRRPDEFRSALPNSSGPNEAPARLLPESEYPATANLPTRIARTDSAVFPYPVQSLEQVKELTAICGRMLICTDEHSRFKMLSEIRGRIGTLNSGFDKYCNHPQFQLCAALERLIKKNLSNSKTCTFSTFESIASAIDLLLELHSSQSQLFPLETTSLNIMVVDDDLFARRAIVGALQLTFDKPIDVESGESALELAVEHAFDLIFMDVQMPAMDGFTTCEMIRLSKLNRDTPVVFVSGRWDAGLRTQMIQSGGREFIQKPVLAAEINLKALTSVIRSRLQLGLPGSDHAFEKAGRSDLIQSLELLRH